MRVLLKYTPILREQSRFIFFPPWERNDYSAGMQEISYLMVMKRERLKMSFLAEPTDANYRGNVHGGKVMKWIDEIGYALAVQYAGKYCVTKFVDDIEFLEPIHIGDLVQLKAKIVKVGNTSVRIHVNVTSEHLIEGTKKKIVIVISSLFP